MRINRNYIIVLQPRLSIHLIAFREVLCQLSHDARCLGSSASAILEREIAHKRLKADRIGHSLLGVVPLFCAQSGVFGSKYLRNQRFTWLSISLIRGDDFSSCQNGKVTIEGKPPLLGISSSSASLSTFACRSTKK